MNRGRPVKILAQALAVAGLAAVAAAVLNRRAPAPGEREVSLEVGGRRFVGDLLVPAARGAKPFVLLLHGSCPEAGRLLLYRELGRRLCAAGCVVLAIDQRGHGRSERLERVGSPADLDFVGDAARLAREAPRLLRLRRTACTIVAGHSFGGGVAAAALFEPSVCGVISISPGRRIRERFTAAGNEEGLRYVQGRKTLDMALAEPIPIEIVRSMLESYDIAKLEGSTLPKPLLLVEGALENGADLEFTAKLAAGLRGPVERVVIPVADHYYGTSLDPAAKGRVWIVSREDVVQSLADAMMEWMKRLPELAGR